MHFPVTNYASSNTVSAYLADESDQRWMLLGVRMGLFRSLLQMHMVTFCNYQLRWEYALVLY